MKTPPRPAPGPIPEKHTRFWEVVNRRPPKAGEDPFERCNVITERRDWQGRDRDPSAKLEVFRRGFGRIKLTPTQLSWVADEAITEDGLWTHSRPHLQLLFRRYGRAPLLDMANHSYGNQIMLSSLWGCPYDLNMPGNDFEVFEKTFGIAPPSDGMLGMFGIWGFDIIRFDAWMLKNFPDTYIEGNDSLQSFITRQYSPEAAALILRLIAATDSFCAANRLPLRPEPTLQTH